MPATRTAAAPDANNAYGRTDADLIPLPAAPLAAARLGWEPMPAYRTIYNAVLDQRLPAVRISGRVFLRPRDLAAFVAAQIEEPVPDVPAPRSRRAAASAAVA